MTPHAAGAAAQLASPVACTGLHKLFRQRILKGPPSSQPGPPSGPPTVTVLGDWPEVLGSEGEWRDLLVRADAEGARLIECLAWSRRVAAVRGAR